MEEFDDFDDSGVVHTEGYDEKFQEMEDAFVEFTNKVASLEPDIENPLFQSYILVIGANVLIARQRMGKYASIEDVMEMLRDVYADQVMEMVDEEYGSTIKEAKQAVKH